MAKKKHEEHVNHERWLVSYADFITLLFAFFVIMYALSEVDKNKLKKFNDSVQFAFSFVGSGGTFTMGKTQQIKKPEIIGDNYPKGQRQSDPGHYDSFTAIVQYIDNTLFKWFVKEERDSIEVVHSDKAIIIRMDAERLFPPGGSRVRPDRKSFLMEFGEVVRNHRVSFLVRQTVIMPFGGDEIEEHDLGIRRNDALIRGAWSTKLDNRAHFGSAVDIEEVSEVETSEGEKSRTVFEFLIQRRT